MSVLWTLVLAGMASVAIWLLFDKAPRTDTVPAASCRKRGRRTADPGDQQEGNG